MLDPDFIRQNPEKVRQGAASKGADPSLVDKWLKTDEERRSLIGQVDQLRAERNRFTKELQAGETAPSEKKLSRGRELKEKIRILENRLALVSGEWERLLRDIPALPEEDVPAGKDETENVVVRKWGSPTRFNFKPRDHLELGERLGLIDVKRAGKVSGSRFGYLTGDLVLLEFALMQFGLEVTTGEGFIPVLPPVMIKKEMEAGLGYGEHGGWEDMYILDKDNLVLVATAEHSLVARYAEETFDEKLLPRRYVGFSTCFRREAGSYGKDTRGILRLHQFNKLEMVSFTRPEDSRREHKYLIEIEEKLMRALQIPYRVVKMCTGDLGHPAASKFDIEAWMPGQNKYRETHSCSNCTDYQSRRLNIRFRRQGGSEYVHILNGTVFSERPLIAVLENYQQEDGSVVIPEVLRRWVGKDKIMG
ncbi:serine--tRNA ligase [candidate division CPR3 bacterium 4484_211]|uniref:Serine--tRNA ligase n=1 Tax=candidate division CPR3 bacterium 4484_211 TaxID=1968527 RepID=A0A1W9NYF4_UNCC3|nr:MAG: serine--tRNA ligase [candidate division CPR3 bacterium 4484_211]